MKNKKEENLSDDEIWEKLFNSPESDNLLKNLSKKAEEEFFNNENGNDDNFFIKKEEKEKNKKIK